MFVIHLTLHDRLSDQIYVSIPRSRMLNQASPGNGWYGLSMAYASDPTTENLIDITAASRERYGVDVPGLQKKRLCQFENLVWLT